MSNDTPRTEVDAMNRLRVQAKNRVLELENELVRLRERLAEAEALAERSTRRLVELSAPGSIGAFAARDHWMARAQQAEQRAERAEQDAERYRFLRAETDRVDPVAAVSWKWKMNRESSEWANTSCAKSLDELCDGQIAARSAT